MKALLLDGSRGKAASTPVAAEALAGALRRDGYAVDTLPLRELDVAPCTGCFGCWVKTPGECVIDDVARDIARRILLTDVLALVTPVTFGGYSSELKKVMDRLICVLDPRFTTIGGEVHHRPRYPHYPRVIALGTLPVPDDEAAETFRTLAVRNALNMHTTADVEVLVGEVATTAAARAAEGLLAGKAVA